MTNSLPTYYWDACLFLEWLRKERATPQKRQAIKDCLKENAEKKSVIITSAVTHIEVLPKKITPSDAENEEKYWKFFDSICFFDVPVDKQVVSLAREIKDYHYKDVDPSTGASYRMLSTGDAVHLATAIIHNARELHTRDKSKRGGNIPLIGLDQASPGGMIAGRWKLAIVSPEASQLDVEDYAEDDGADS